MKQAVLIVLFFGVALNPVHGFRASHQVPSRQRMALPSVSKLTATIEVNVEGKSIQSSRVGGCKEGLISDTAHVGNLEVPRVGVGTISWSSDSCKLV